ncbi:MAG TPA: hypothetical protein VFH37_03465 [Candidatus Saccharimonadales bacterium]|nr:hypothetical protein [Candidatus Saccharimonadales bacterium]
MNEKLPAEEHSEPQGRQMHEIPDSQEAQRQVAAQEGEFFHLYGDDGEGLDLPLDGKLMAERVRNALDRRDINRLTP